MRHLTTGQSDSVLLLLCLVRLLTCLPIASRSIVLNPAGVWTNVKAEKQLLDGDAVAAAAAGGELPVSEGKSAPGGGSGPPTIPKRVPAETCTCVVQVKCQGQTPAQQSDSCKRITKIIIN